MSREYCFHVLRVPCHQYFGAQHCLCQNSKLSSPMTEEESPFTRTVWTFPPVPSLFISFTNCSGPRSSRVVFRWPRISFNPRNPVFRIVGAGLQPCRAASARHRLLVITFEMILVSIKTARPHPMANDSKLIAKSSPPFCGFGVTEELMGNCTAD